MLRMLRPALSLLAVMVVLTGLAYPLAMTGVAQVVFPDQANGSLIHRNGHVVGSRLIAQNFTGPEYFHPRPSDAGKGYDAANSGASNLGPSSKKLISDVDKRAQRAQQTNGHPHQPVPMDLVTTSASGLDPDLSPAAAVYQARRVAEARGLSVNAVMALIRAHTRGRTLGVLGEPRVNVLELNLALDRIRHGHS